MQLRFLGGAGTVTGSKLMVEHAGRRVLLDCGLFQGLKRLRLLNRSALSVPSRSIDAVVLTQAHLLHSGFLPRLVELGYRGPVFATAATAELCRLLLPAAGRLQEAEARQANLLGYSMHRPALPLYTEETACRATELLQPCAFDEWFEPAAGLQLQLRPAGLAPGAASVHLRCAGRSLLYSGALGRADDPLMRPPAPVPAVDRLLLEATYGNRQHRLPDAMARLGKLAARTAARGGLLLLPAHPAGPAQHLLQALQRLKAAARMPELPICLDSRLAADALAVYARHAGELRSGADGGGHLLDGVTVAQGPEEVLHFVRQGTPGILIASEGMAQGRPLAQHLRLLAPDPRHAIAFTSYQPVGTHGAALLAGEPRIKVQGDWVPVRAEVQALDGLSGRADRQGLLDWAGAMPRSPEHAYLMLGEPDAADSLRQALTEQRHWDCSVPEYLELANIREPEPAESHGMAG